MSMKNLLLIAMLTGCVSLVAGCKPESAPVAVEKGWVRLAPPSAMASAGYFEIINRSDVAIEITRVTADRFARVEIHETSMVDGTMKMRPMAAIAVAPGQTVTLKPGGQHLMLFEPDGAAAGDDVRITLYEGERPIAEIEIPVARSNPYE